MGEGCIVLRGSARRKPIWTRCLQNITRKGQISGVQCTKPASPELIIGNKQRCIQKSKENGTNRRHCRKRLLVPFISNNAYGTRASSYCWTRHIIQGMRCARVHIVSLVFSTLLLYKEWHPYLTTLNRKQTFTRILAAIGTINECEPPALVYV